MARTAARIDTDQTPRPLMDNMIDHLMPDGPNNQASQAAWARVEPALPDILDGFYRALHDTPDIASRLGDDPKSVGKLKHLQTAHWQYILTQSPDLDFQGRALRIAEAHIRIGLPSHWYIAAYGRILHDAIPALMGGKRLGGDKATAEIQALISRVFLDICLAQDGYENGINQRREKLSKRENDLKSLKGIAETIVDINDLALNMAVLSANTDDATSNSQSISAAAEELVASVEQIASNSDGAAEQASQTNTTVDHSITAITGVADSIADVARTSEETAQSLSGLHEASEQIGSFLTVIENIADQTNLLALNATIEAARAGEAGKGFAVVASEVKSLATQAAKATEDIAQRITALQEGMAAIQGSIEESRAAADRGQATIDGANASIRTVGTQVSDVSGRMQEIASILQQQQDTCSEISANITGVADLASENRDRLSAMNGALQHSNDSFLDSAQAWFRSDCHRSLVQMAKIDHVFFKKRIVDIVLGRLDEAASGLPDHHGCRLGKWYDTIDIQEIRDHSAFKAIIDPHSRFHQTAVEIVQAKEVGDMRSAFAKLEELERLSKEVIGHLEDLAVALDSELDQADGRQYFRSPGDGMRATMRVGATTRDVEVIDISETGIGVTGLTPEDVGKTVNITVNGEEALGEAVWADSKAGGIRLMTGQIMGG